MGRAEADRGRRAGRATRLVRTESGAEGMQERQTTTRGSGPGMRRSVPVLLIALLAAVPVAAGAEDDGRRLIEAVRAEDAGAVRSLLDRGADVRAAQPDGATALHWASYRDASAVAALLIAAGADVDAANDYGITPLALACENGAGAMVRRLLEAGADPNVSRATGETPLMTCARTGDGGAVEALLARGADPDAAESWRKQTALMWAAGAGHTPVARALVAHGADARARSAAGFTPLLIAAREDRPALARLLLDAGAEVSAETPDGLTPLLVATLRGHAALAVSLLERGADPNAGGAGYTALHWAAGSWHTELTGSLRGIATERDDEWRSLNGLRSGRLALVEALLARGANPDARLVAHPPQFGFASQRFRVSPVGATPFLLAAMDGNLAVMRALAAAGVDLRLATEQGTTPLMAASGLGRVPAETRVTESESLEAVRFLLRHGADVNAANGDGRTALHGAAHIRSDALVQLLVDHGAEVRAGDRRGITPLMIAEGGGHILLPGLGGGSTADLLRALGGGEEGADLIGRFSEGPIR